MDTYLEIISYLRYCNLKLSLYAAEAAHKFFELKRKWNKILTIVQDYSERFKHGNIIF